MTVDDFPDSQEKLTHINETVSQWMRAKKLKLNPGKTETILV